MQQLSNRVAATITATLHVFGTRLREDKGQAAAEYVGILCFVALVVGAIIADNWFVSFRLENGILRALTSLGGSPPAGR